MANREKEIEKAIEHFKYVVSHDISSEPVTTYARLAIEALKRMPREVKPFWLDTLGEVMQLCEQRQQKNCDKCKYSEICGKAPYEWGIDQTEIIFTDEERIKGKDLLTSDPTLVAVQRTAGGCLQFISKHFDFPLNYDDVNAFPSIPPHRTVTIREIIDGRAVFPWEED